MKTDVLVVLRLTDIEGYFFNKNLCNQLTSLWIVNLRFFKISDNKNRNANVITIVAPGGKL
jgi:hypothetical protein